MKKICILIPVFLLLTSSLKGQISANFRQKISEKFNLTVQFEAFLQDTLTYTYHWDFGDGLTAAGPVTQHTYSNPGEYTVTLTISDGINHVTHSQQALAQANFEITNVFTPNNDGYNDLFVIHTDGLTRYTLTVYSRSGTIVHRSTSFTPVWDGRTPAGEYVHSGIYYYVVRLGGETGEFEKSGFVHLIREKIKE
jgi:gliding motility-associated-like protein